MPAPVYDIVDGFRAALRHIEEIPLQDILHYLSIRAIGVGMETKRKHFPKDDTK